VVVEEKNALMRKLGKKQLTLHLQTALAAIPPALAGLPLELVKNGTELIYTFDTQAAETGIASLLRKLNDAGVEFKDRFGLTGGVDELLGHIAAVHQFMPGLRLERQGEARHCQGLVLADWVAVAQDGTTKARGTNAFTMSADGRIASVTGFWSNHPAS